MVAITDVEFSRDGELVAIGASDGAVRILRIAEGSRPQVVAQGENPVREIALSPDGKLLASATFIHVKLIPLDQEHNQAICYDVGLTISFEFRRIWKLLADLHPLSVGSRLVG